MFKGLLVPLVTPFTDSGDVCYKQLGELVDWLMEEGVNGFVCCGTTAERSTLSIPEQLDITRFVLERVCGKVPVIAGTGCDGTIETIVLTEKAKKLGVDGCLVITPSYNKPTFEGIYRHFQEIAKVGLPIILYHNPGRTGVLLTASQIKQICSIPGVVGIKESSGNLNLIKELKDMPGCLLSGDDSLTIPIMKMGGVGAIAAMANVLPRKLSQIISYSLKGDYNEALNIWNKCEGLCKVIFKEVNPQGLKYAMFLTGRCGSRMRLPLVEPREETKNAIIKELAEYGSST